jgi:predicted nucleic acid-binding protein
MSALRLVIDASVCLKWYLPDEALQDKAEAVLTDYERGSVEIVAPTLLIYELMNGLWIGSRLKRIEFQAIEKCVQRVLDLSLDFRDASLFFSAVVRMCNQFGRSAYDSAYLALAEKEGIQLLTADRRLYNTVRRRLGWVVWLGSYPQ